MMNKFNKLLYVNVCDPPPKLWRIAMSSVILLFLVLFTANAQSGSVSVSGTVTDDTNDPLPGVNVLVKGTTIDPQTARQCRYKLCLR